MLAMDHGKTSKDFVILAGSVVRLPNSPNVPMKTHKLLLTFIAFLSGLTFTVSSRADDFEPASVILDNHAALVPVLDGVRRVRVSYLDVQNQWQAYSMAHLAGDEGQIKLRLPDELSLADVLVEVSYTDPFPYEVYAGRSDFVMEADGAITSITDIRTGADFAADGNGAPTPEVQESDLWKWKGDTLYFYNQYRGLQVFDFSDPTQPRRSHTLRMPALGEDMYLHPDGDHLILLAKRWSWGSDSVGSEVVVVRHSDEGLAIINRIPLPGNSVVESRMVGSHLYVAMRNSRRIDGVDEADQPIVHWETGLTVEHTDLSDPTNPVTAEPLNLFSTDGWWYNATVSATPDYFIVAPFVYDRESSSYHSSIHLIDIRDQSAPLKIAASAELDGHLKDKFKLRIRDNILTCVTQGGRWNNGLRTVVANYDLAALTPDGEIPRLDSLILAPQETLFATRFDGDRVYVVTAIRIDPLFVVDLSDDDNLRLAGELKIPGWSHYLQPRGDRLLSVGVEDRRVAISQFDVSDPSDLGPPLRVYLGEEGSYSWSEGNYDEQAIGYFPDRGVMILPYQSYSRDWSSHETKLQILTFDDDSLEKAGVIDTNFVARRATLIDHSTLVSVSGREVNALDVRDLSDPQPLSSLEVAWPVERVVPYGDYVLQIEGGSNYWDYGNNEQNITLRVTSDDALDTVLAQVKLEGSTIVGAELIGELLHVLTTKNEQDEIDNEQTVWRQVTYHNVVDLTDPTSPIVGDAMLLMKRTLHSSFHGRQLENGLMAWIPEIQTNNWGGGWFAADFGGPWWYGDTTCAQILIVDASEPRAPALTTDYRICLDKNGPVNDDEELIDPGGATVSGIVERGDKIYVSFKENKLIQDPEEERNYYEVDHKLRIATLTGNGLIAVDAAVSVPGTVEGIREVGDDSGLLLLSSAPATRIGNDQRIWWSSDLVLQTSAFDGLTAFLIDEVTIPDAYYHEIQVTESHFAVPSYTWNQNDSKQGINFHPFDLVGEISDPDLMELDFYPNELTLNKGILSTTGWAHGHQVWWMLNPATLGDDEPTVVQSANQFYVNLNHAFYDRDRLLAWVPVGAYGVETVNITPLFKESEGLKRSKSVLTKRVEATWVQYELICGNLTPAGAEDALGALASDEIWRYKVNEPVTYAGWMARQMSEEGNPKFVTPAENDDNDGDGISNWGEFAMGTNPIQPDAPLMRVERSVNGEQVEIGIELPRGHQGVSWEVQASRNLTDWESLPIVKISASITDLDTTKMALRFPVDPGRGTVFFRLQTSPSDEAFPR